MHWLLCIVIQYFFDIPILTFEPFIKTSLLKELDFNLESENMEKARQFLTESVYIPKVYHASKYLLITEWIDGQKIDDIRDDPNQSIKNIVTKLVDVFSNQIFVSGFVHCDPHPGNILIRKDKNNKDEVVLLDFGLCVEVKDSFRNEQCQLWKAIQLHDLQEIKNITLNWGIKNDEMFVSSQLMRPFNKNKKLQEKVTNADLQRMQLKFKKDLNQIIKDADQLPKEIIFINRNMQYIRALNKRTDCTVNRVNLMAQKAYDTLQQQMNLYTRLKMSFSLYLG